MLARTSVAPELAPALLRCNADWGLDHLASEAPTAGEAAHRLLVRLNADATWVARGRRGPRGR